VELESELTAEIKRDARLYGKRTNKEDDSVFQEFSKADIELYLDFMEVTVLNSVMTDEEFTSNLDAEIYKRLLDTKQLAAPVKFVRENMTNSLINTQILNDSILDIDNKPIINFLLLFETDESLNARHIQVLSALKQQLGLVEDDNSTIVIKNTNRNNVLQNNVNTLTLTSDNYFYLPGIDVNKGEALKYKNTLLSFFENKDTMAIINFLKTKQSSYVVKINNGVLPLQNYLTLLENDLNSTIEHPATFAFFRNYFTN